MTHDGPLNFDDVGLFAPLSQAEREQLLKQCRIKRYPAGSHIIDSASDSRDVYFVIRGMVRVVNYSASGREVALDDINAGGSFGELAALDGGPRSAFVMPHVHEAVTAAMPFEVFLDLLAHNPAISLAVMKRLALMVRQANERIMDLSILGANNRVQAELLRRALGISQDGRTAVLQPIPVHGDIASRVSTTRETVARVMSDLAKHGLVERKKDSLVFHDLEQLALLVEEVRNV